MLRWRLSLGVVLIASLVGLMWADQHAQPPASYLFWLTLVAGVLGAGEVVALLGRGGHRPLAGVIYGGTVLTIASNAVPLFWLRDSAGPGVAGLGWPLLALAGSLLAALAGEMLRYREPGRSIVQAALATFGVAYVGVLLSFALQLRVLGGPQAGMVAVVAMIVVVKLGDSGAYITGRLLGRHKMSPRISPGKTFEGAAGGLAFSCVGAWVVFRYLPPAMGAELELPGWTWLAFGLVVSLAGMIGDLAESLLKRDMGAKDSSTWMPGFGGVLDLLDSILFAAPVAYVCWLVALS